MTKKQATTGKPATNGKQPVTGGLPVFSFIQEPIYYEVMPDLTVELTNLPVVKSLDDITYITAILRRFSPVDFYNYAPELKQSTPGEQVYLVCEWAVDDWAGTGEPPNPEMLKQDPAYEWAVAGVYEFVNNFFQQAYFLPKPGNHTDALSSD